jgi:hypothetical protein
LREALFIKKNKDRWLKDQHMPPDDPDEMAASFTQLVDDLAYAKTFYPSGKVTHYIPIYLDIYKNRKVILTDLKFCAMISPDHPETSWDHAVCYLVYPFFCDRFLPHLQMKT